MRRRASIDGEGAAEGCAPWSQSIRLPEALWTTVISAAVSGNSGQRAGDTIVLRSRASAPLGLEHVAAGHVLGVVLQEAAGELEQRGDAGIGERVVDAAVLAAGRRQSPPPPAWPRGGGIWRGPSPPGGGLP